MRGGLPSLGRTRLLLAIGAAAALGIRGYLDWRAGTGGALLFVAAVILLALAVRVMLSRH
jgi:hypothetical protein